MTTTSDADLRAALSSALGADAPASGLEAAVAEHFPDLRAFRENDDLILVGSDTRRLLIRRAGLDRFVVSDAASASASTNLLDGGGEAERDLDGLVHAIRTFAAV